MISQTCLTAPTGVPLLLSTMLVGFEAAFEAAAGRAEATEATAASPTRPTRSLTPRGRRRGIVTKSEIRRSPVGPRQTPGVEQANSSGTTNKCLSAVVGQAPADVAQDGQHPPDVGRPGQPARRRRHDGIGQLPRARSRARARACRPGSAPPRTTPRPRWTAPRPATATPRRRRPRRARRSGSRPQQRGVERQRVGPGGAQQRDRHVRRAAVHDPPAAGHDRRAPRRSAALGDDGLDASAPCRSPTASAPGRPSTAGSDGSSSCSDERGAGHPRGDVGERARAAPRPATRSSSRHGAVVGDARGARTAARAPAASVHGPAACTFSGPA